MPSILNATTTNGLVTSADNSGSLQLQTNNGTTAVTIDTSQRAAFVAGTAALPAITTSGDTNTGMFFPAADTIAFAEGGTETMRLDSSGNVGIGTSSPGAKLVIVGATQVRAGDFPTTGNGLELTFTAGNAAYIQGYDRGASAWRDVVVGGNTLQFSTGGTERMRIDSSGRLLVNTTTVNAQMNLRFTGNSTEGFYINDSASSAGSAAIRFAFGGNGCGGIILNTNSTTYQTSSDYRLKENIAPMTGALAKVAQLRPVTYNWKTDGSAGQGFIAHELQAVVPDCVTGEKDAVDEEGNPRYQGVDTSFLVATLTAAIQELKAQLDSSNLILTSVKTELDTVKAELNTLKNPPVEGTE